MVLRNIVKIDESKCDGCGLCVSACAEGAIEIRDGKARLVGENYCDGLGACLGHCPQGAISVEKRESAEFDEVAVQKRIKSVAEEKKQPAAAGFVCPGLMSKKLGNRAKGDAGEIASGGGGSMLGHWPVQLKLVSPGAEFLRGADLLLAADCVAFAVGDFHSQFLKGRSLLIGCPKLDDAAYYVDKLAEIILFAEPSSLTVVHMQVPCCSGLTRIVELAREKANVEISFEDVTVSVEGEVIAKRVI